MLKIAARNNETNLHVELPAVCFFVGVFGFKINLQRLLEPNSESKAEIKHKKKNFPQMFKHNNTN